MAARTGIKFTASRLNDHDEPAQDQFSQRKRPDIKQFRLQVDRQTKASFDSVDDAQAAGLVIKTAHPIVQVSIYDVTAGENRIIELPTE